MSKLSGNCLCGAVTVSFEPADQLSVCHCDTCRRWAGSMFLEIDAKPGTVSYDGSVKAYASSDFAERAWCDRCGSTLWFHLTMPGQDYYSMSAGLVDDFGGLDVNLEIYIDEKPDGFALAGDHKRITKADHEAKVAAFMAKAAESQEHH